jgi:hypothetical protein
MFGGMHWRRQVELDERLLRVQVKRLDAASCDYLFVVVGDRRRWCIPTQALRAGSHISIGGPKYAEFEVEPGRPLPPRTDQQHGSTIVSLDPRGDVRAAKGVAL